MSDKYIVDKANNNLRKIIDESKMTREQIANAIDCDTSSITKYYNGIRKPSTEIVIKLSKLFNVSTDYLLGLTDIATTDLNLRAICDYTGLNMDSIEILNRLKQIKRNDVLQFGNELIEYLENNADAIGKFLLDRNLLYHSYDSLISDESTIYASEFANWLTLWKTGNELYFQTSQFRLSNAFNNLINSNKTIEATKMLDELFNNNDDMNS